MSGLRKQKEYDWKDSNVSMLGSDKDREVKKEAAETEEAWQGAGQSPGLEIWRIVKFKVKRWAKEDYGRFYSGDSYIILYTYKPDPDSEKLAWDLHFWIGKHSTQDEYGTAAYKTVELDTFLDDGPVQHREVQGHESQRFRSYFKRIELLEGGADSGFRHVEPKEYKPRLLHFHGKGKNIEVKQVGLEKDRLDPTDVFVLDQGVAIFVWQGPEAHFSEKHKAIQYAQQLSSERSGGRVEVVDEDDKDSDFYKELSDEAHEPEEEEENDCDSFTKSLFRLSDSTGSFEFSKVKEGNPCMDDFDPKDVFIYDTGKEVFCWIGRRTSRSEQQQAMSYSHNYLMKTSHPLIPISCIKQGSETREFKMALSA